MENLSFGYSLNREISDFLKGAECYSLGAGEIDGIATAIGAEIKEVGIKWDFYQEFDEEGEIKEEK